MNIKKFILSLGIVILSTLCVWAEKQTFCKGRFLYSIGNDSDATIIGYQQDDFHSAFDTIQIPSSVSYNNILCNVKSISSNAFAGCNNIYHVIIEDGIERIGDNAFAGCVNLESIIMPKTLCGWGEGMFAYCIRLKSIKVYESNDFFMSDDNTNALITKDDSTLVVGCKGTIIPSYVAKIGKASFLCCIGLERMYVPEGVKIIDSQAFSGCSSLKSIDLPNSLEKIANSAFADCESLDSLMIPMNVNTIEPDYFLSYCKRLKSLSVDPRNKYYDSRENCNGIIRRCDSTLIVGCKTTRIPEGVVAIGLACFRHVDIHELIIPSTVRNIPASAFCGAEDIEKIIVDSNNLKYTSLDNCNAIFSIGGDTLILGCENSVISKFVKTIGEYSFWGREKSTLLNIPEGVKIISPYAYANCHRIIYLFTPNSLNSIDHNAFLGCKNLRVVDFSVNVETVANEAFSDCPSLSIINAGGRTIFPNKTKK